MDREVKAKIEFWLKRFHFVQWDRFIENNDAYVIYGWIERKKDSYKDFLVIEWSKEKRTVDYWTSSNHERHKEILDILKASRFFQKESDSIECKRVEHNFNIPNSIKLKRSS